jgi:hypothetical protein
MGSDVIFAFVASKWGAFVGRVRKSALAAAAQPTTPINAHTRLFMSLLLWRAVWARSLWQSRRRTLPRIEVNQKRILQGNWKYVMFGLLLDRGTTY